MVHRQSVFEWREPNIFIDMHTALYQCILKFGLMMSVLANKMRKATPMHSFWLFCREYNIISSSTPASWVESRTSASSSEYCLWSKAKHVASKRLFFVCWKNVPDWDIFKSAMTLSLLTFHPDYRYYWFYVSFMLHLGRDISIFN